MGGYPSQLPSTRIGTEDYDLLGHSVCSLYTAPVRCRATPAFCNGTCSLTPCRHDPSCLQAAAARKHAARVVRVLLSLRCRE